MSSVAIPRSVRHPGATGKSRLPTVAVGTPVILNDGRRGDVEAVRRRGFPRRYGVRVAGEGRSTFVRRNEFSLHGLDAGAPDREGR